MLKKNNLTKIYLEHFHLLAKYPLGPSNVGVLYRFLTGVQGLKDTFCLGANLKIRVGGEHYRITISILI